MECIVKRESARKVKQFLLDLVGFPRLNSKKEEGMIILLILPVFTWCLQECFEEYQNHSLIGSTIVSLDNVSLKKCHQACLEIKNQRCRSVMFVRMKLHCLINSQDKEENPNAFFRVMDTVDYYHRTCYDKPSVAVLRDSSLFQDQCYEITKGKVLIGIVDHLIQDVRSIEHCRKACQKSKEMNDIVCKSAIFYKKEKQCIIASQSRHDIPDLFIDDEGAIYLENTCLHDERKSIDSKNVLSGTNVIKKKENVVNSNTSEEREKTKIVGRISTTSSMPTLSIMHSILTTSSHFPLSTSQTSQNRKPSGVEISGYDSFSESTSHETQIVSATKNEVPSIDPKTIDSYNVDTPVEKSASVASYGVKLHDSRVKNCFTAVVPIHPMEQTRVTKAYSLEQCIDICRLCWRCLRGKKCMAVAFEMSGELCALSTSSIVDGGVMDDDVIYHNRGDC